jgi:hypothetical protein
MLITGLSQHALETALPGLSEQTGPAEDRMSM